MSRLSEARRPAARRRPAPARRPRSRPPCGAGPSPRGPRPGSPADRPPHQCSGGGPGAPVIRPAGGGPFDRGRAPGASASRRIGRVLALAAAGDGLLELGEHPVRDRALGQAARSRRGRAAAASSCGSGSRGVRLLGRSGSAGAAARAGLPRSRPGRPPTRGQLLVHDLVVAQHQHPPVGRRSRRRSPRAGSARGSRSRGRRPRSGAPRARCGARRPGPTGPRPRPRICGGGAPAIFAAEGRGPCRGRFPGRPRLRDARLRQRHRPAGVAAQLRVEGGRVAQPVGVEVGGVVGRAHRAVLGLDLRPA